MRYITRELYEQIQFTSWIEFELSPKKSIKCYSQSDIEILLQNEIDQRLKMILALPNEVKKMYKYNDVEEDYKEYINEKVMLLKKYVPEYIKKDIYDYRLLVLNILSKDLYKKLVKWKVEIELNWKNACNEYNKQYKAIKQQLSYNVKKFTSYSMHEQKILSLNKLSKDKLCIEYKNGCWGKAFLNFEGVKTIEIEGDIKGSSWLYDEIYLSDKGNFEYQALLDNSELKIIANDIYISFANSDYVNEALKLEDNNDIFNIVLETIRDKAITIGRENLLQGEKNLLLIDTLICMLTYESITPKYEKISSGFEQFLVLNSKRVPKILNIFKEIGENHIATMLIQAINIYSSDKEECIRSEELKKLDKEFLNYEKSNINDLYKLFIDYIKENISRFH